MQKIILLLIGALVVVFIGLIIIANLYSPVGGGSIVHYRCETASDKIVIVGDYIIFPESGNCQFTERNPIPITYSWEKGFGDDLEYKGKLDINAELVLDRSCRTYVVDILPYVNNLYEESYGMFRDQNGQIYACVGLGGT